MRLHMHSTLTNPDRQAAAMALAATLSELDHHVDLEGVTINGGDAFQDPFAEAPDEDPGLSF